MPVPPKPKRVERPFLTAVVLMRRLVPALVADCCSLLEESAATVVVGWTRSFCLRIRPPDLVWLVYGGPVISPLLPALPLSTATALLERRRGDGGGVVLPPFLPPAAADAAAFCCCLCRLLLVSAALKASALRCLSLMPVPVPALGASLLRLLVVGSMDADGCSGMAVVCVVDASSKQQ